jgi:hypothetical protein
MYVGGIFLYYYYYYYYYYVIRIPVPDIDTFSYRFFRSFNLRCSINQISLQIQKWRLD